MAKSRHTRRARRAAFLILSLIGPAAVPAAACEPGRIELLTADGRQSFTIEIADDPTEQALGLMFRPSMAVDAGMLFIFEPTRPASFWMRNTMIPLDMLFIDDTGRVETIAVRMDTYSTRSSASEGPVRAVLEINAGLSEKLGIAPGAQAVHPAFEAAPDAAACLD